MSELPDPEREWERPPGTQSIDLAEVVSRIGPTQEPLSILSGGRANLNVRVGKDWVLRIARRDPAALRKEAILLLRPWRSFRVPALRESGKDYLVSKYVPHVRLADTAEHGAAAGRALAEIHAVRYPVAGHFGDRPEIARPLPDFVGALREHIAERLEQVALPAAGELRRDVLQLFDSRLGELRAAAGPPVLLHGDFKPSNLRWADGALLVLDWEFAYAGPALMDFGQLIRWRPSRELIDAAAMAYRDGGGTLPGGWEHLADTFDLGNLAGLLAGAPAGSRRANDGVRRIRQTLQEKS